MVLYNLATLTLFDVYTFLRITRLIVGGKKSYLSHSMISKHKLFDYSRFSCFRIP